MQIIPVIVGLLIGALATAFTVLKDPLGLFESAAVTPIEAPAQLILRSGITRGISANPSGMLGFEENQVHPFAEAALRYARLDVVLLDSADGGARALAVKVSAPRADNSLVSGRLVADSVWNLMWPGHGSLFLVGRDDYRSLLADQTVNLLTGEGFQASPQPVPITIAPRLLGGGGRLIVATGTYREYRSPAAGTELELGLSED